MRRLIPGVLPAYVAALALGLSPVFWSQSIIAEVYTLNTFFLLLLVYLGLDAERRPGVLPWMALVFGLSLANHYPLMLLAAPAFAVLLWPLRAELLRRIGLLLILVVVGLLPYAWLVRRSWSGLPISFYGELDSVTEILFFLSRAGYAEVDHSPTAGWLDAQRPAPATPIVAVGYGVDQDGASGGAMTYVNDRTRDVGTILFRAKTAFVVADQVKRDGVCFGDSGGPDFMTSNDGTEQLVALSVVVNAYGNRTPLKTLAQVTLRPPQTLVIAVHDTALVSAVVSAVRECGMSLNPSEQGNSVIVNFPPPSAEMRAEVVRMASKKAEEARTKIRNVRRDAMDLVKKHKDNMSKDDVHRVEKQVQALTDEFTKQIDTLQQGKEKELNTA